jgi:hypothetical protein
MTTGKARRESKDSLKMISQVRSGQVLLKREMLRRLKPPIILAYYLL